MTDDAPILRRNGTPASVLAAIVTEPETIASLAADFSTEYSIIKSVVCRLRSRGLIERSREYGKPLVATDAGRRAIFALHPYAARSHTSARSGNMLRKMDQK